LRLRWQSYDLIEVESLGVLLHLARKVLHQSSTGEQSALTDRLLLSSEVECGKPLHSVDAREQLSADLGAESGEPGSHPCLAMYANNREISGM